MCTQVTFIYVDTYTGWKLKDYRRVQLPMHSLLTESEWKCDQTSSLSLGFPNIMNSHEPELFLLPIT